MIAPGAVVVEGLAAGAAYGLLGAGLVATYRTSRVLNFAHGEIGVVAATGMGLVVSRGWLPYGIALPLGVVVGAALGAVTHLAAVHRLRRAAPAMAIVATLGVSQVAFLVAEALRQEAPLGGSFPDPPLLRPLRLPSIVVSAGELGLILVALVAAGLGWWVLRRSPIGRSVRAVADNPDAARTLGVPTTIVEAGVWAAAGGIAAVTAAMLLPSRGFTTAAAIGPGLLLRALLAALMARMTSLHVAVGAGVAVATAEAVLRRAAPAVPIDVVLVVAVGLVAFGRPPERSAVRSSSPPPPVVRWEPLPRALASVPSVRRLAIGATVGVALASVALPALVPPTGAQLLATLGAFALIALSVGVVTGLGGGVSLGQVALAGVGATVAWRVGVWSGSFVLGVLAAAAAAAVVAVAVGAASLRGAGSALTVTSLGFAVACQTWVLRQPWMLGAGVTVPRPVLGTFAFDTAARFALVVTVVLAIGIALAAALRRSRAGRRLVATRDNAAAAAAFGIRPVAARVQTLALGGFLAGLGGALYGHALVHVDSGAFSAQAGIDAVASAAVGGLVVLGGPVIGTVFVRGLPELLPQHQAALAASATGWLLLVLYLPGGLSQLVLAVRDGIVDLLARRSGIDPQAVRTARPAPAPVAPLCAVTRSPRPRTTTSPVLDASALRRRFGAHIALDGVDLALWPGETLAIVGANGAGKTTLFDLLSGAVRPDEGTVRLLGEDVTRLPTAARARRGLVRTFQTGSLFPTLTAAETVELAADRSPDGRSGAVRRRAAREALASAGLEDWADVPVGRLSTGQRRLVEVATVLVSSPCVLLLDEPSSGLAQPEAQALATVLGGVVASREVAIAITGHDLDLLDAVADRTVSLVAGRMSASDRPVVAVAR